MKIVAIMGSPGTGKSTLMRAFMAGGEWQLVKDEELPLVAYHRNGDTAILGKYEEGELFSGTDRLSMAVQPQVVEWLAKAESLGIKRVLFEGDRLSNQSFLEHIVDAYDSSIVYLTVSAEERQRRYEQRGSNQSEQFLRGRETKYANLTSNMVLQFHTETFSNATPEEMKSVLEYIAGVLQ